MYVSIHGLLCHFIRGLVERIYIYMYTAIHVHVHVCTATVVTMESETKSQLTVKRAPMSTSKPRSVNPEAMTL